MVARVRNTRLGDLSATRLACAGVSRGTRTTNVAPGRVGAGSQRITASVVGDGALVDVLTADGTSLRHLPSRVAAAGVAADVC